MGGVEQQYQREQDVTTTGEKIKRLAEERGWTLPYLAARAGLDGPDGYQIVAGVASGGQVRVSVLARIAAALGVPPSELLEPVEVPRVIPAPTAQPQTVAELLEAEIKQRGCTRLQLAEASGCSRTTVQNVLSGGDSYADTLARLAAALGISVDALIPAAELPEPPEPPKPRGRPRGK